VITDYGGGAGRGYLRWLFLSLVPTHDGRRTHRIGTDVIYSTTTEEPSGLILIVIVMMVPSVVVVVDDRCLLALYP